MTDSTTAQDQPQLSVAEDGSFRPPSSSNLEVSLIRANTLDNGSCDGYGQGCTMAGSCKVLGFLATIIAVISLASNQGIIKDDINYLSEAQGNLQTPHEGVDCGGGVFALFGEDSGCPWGGSRPPVSSILSQFEHSLCYCPRDSTQSETTVVKDIAQLSMTEKKLIVAGLHIMKNTTSAYDSRFTTYDYFVDLHKRATRPDSQVHAGWWFYPWHREMMWRMTSELRRVTGLDSISFPYWNWANVDSTASMFSLDYMGPQTGLHQEGYVIKRGNFGQGKWTIQKSLRTLPEEHNTGAILRAPGNGLQMCFDQHNNSYVLE